MYKFNYAIIEACESGGAGMDEIRAYRESGKKFYNLDALGNILYFADLMNICRRGYFKVWIDFLLRGENGEEKRMHIYRVDIGDGLSRAEHLSQDDVEEIERMANS